MQSVYNDLRNSSDSSVPVPSISSSQQSLIEHAPRLEHAVTALADAYDREATPRDTTLAKHTPMSLNAAHEAVISTQARIAHDPCLKIRCSRMLRHESSIAQRVIAIVHRDSVNNEPGKHTLPRDHRFDRIDYVPTWKTLPPVGPRGDRTQANSTQVVD